MTRFDAAHARERQSVRKRLRAGHVDDLKIAIAHCLDDELRVGVDYHRPKVELATFKLCKLLDQRICRGLDVEPVELHQHLASHVFGSACSRTDTDPLAAEPPDQLERIVGRKWQPVLHECEMHAARRLAGRELRDVLDRSRSGNIVDAPAMPIRFFGHLLHDRIVVAALGARKKRDLDVR